MNDQTCPKPCPDCRCIVDDLRNQLADEKSSHKCTLEASLDYRDRCFIAETKFNEEENEHKFTLDAEKKWFYEVNRLRLLLVEIRKWDENASWMISESGIDALHNILDRIDKPKEETIDQPKGEKE